MTQREAILSGALAATKLHNRLDINESITSGCRGSVDVFGSIVKGGARLLFRPLDGLLGACIKGPGVLISTNRPLSVQRFTGAHELGHVAMHHALSLDGDEILTADINQTPEIEIQANAFAAEFLLPRWLLEHHARQQAWNKNRMEVPRNAYQLSLRVGASYEATVRALEKHKIIEHTFTRHLLSITPKTIKQELLPGYTPPNWYRDIWLITEKDKETFIEGQPDDLFCFVLNEKTGAGYLWDFDTLKAKGFAVLSDHRSDKETETQIGSDIKRSLTAHSPVDPKGDFQLKMCRPWQSILPAAAELQIHYNLLGKERGLPRVIRPELTKVA